MAQATIDAGQMPANPEPVMETIERPAFWRMWVSRNKLGAFGLVLLVLILLLSFIGPFFMSGPNRTQVSLSKLQVPSLIDQPSRFPN